jgi:hypothetical protein
MVLVHKVFEKDDLQGLCQLKPPTQVSLEFPSM